MVKNFLPETLTLPLALAESVSKPKLSHSVKFYLSYFHKEKTGKKESLSGACKRGKKARLPVKFLPLKIINKTKILPGLVLALLFYSGLAWRGACIPLLCFFAVLVPGPGGWAVRLFGFSPKYIMPVIGSRNTKINTTEKQAAYNLHYVNIALGIYFWRVFLYPLAAAQLLPVLFLPIKINPYKNKSRHVLQAGQRQKP